jgi:ABC-2 type transport system permease protein
MGGPVHEVAPGIDGRSAPGSSGLWRTLVRLKLRLIANRARTSKGGVVQLVVSCLVALVIGGLGALLAIAAGNTRDPRISNGVIVVGSSLIAFGWAALPLLSFGSDESLDPARLVLFPLRRKPLMQGLLVTAFIGPAPATVILVVIGMVIGYARGLGTLITITAMVLLLVLAATTARTLSTVLAAGLNSRRGRDATIVITSMIVLAVQGLRFVRFTAFDAGTVEGVANVLRWWPPGMLGHAVVDARAGNFVPAVLQLVPAAILIPLLLRWWSVALERSMTVVPGGQTAKRRASADTLPLRFRRLRFLDRGPWGAVTAKELRYVGREPRRKVTLVNSVLFGIALPVWAALRGGADQGSKAVLLATVAGYIAVLGSSNQFGLDGPAVWLDAVAGDTMRSVLVGKNVAVVLEVLPIVTVVGVATAALTGGWLYLPAAFVLSLAGLGVGLATADVVSVLYPIPLPESRSPFAGSGGGQGCSTGFILLVCVMVQNLLLLPVVAAVAVAAFAGPSWMLVVVPLAAAYGAVMWIVGVRVATTQGRQRLPEILRRVDPARSG